MISRTIANTNHQASMASIGRLLPPTRQGRRRVSGTSSSPRQPQRTHRSDAIWPVPNAEPNLARGERPVQARGDAAATHDRSDDRAVESAPMRHRLHRSAILKSGVIDGMAYTGLHTDGSIEAESFPRAS